MNIPIDKLYHYIESVAEQIYRDRVIIYRFWPHGSKNINDLHNLRDLVIEGGLAEWIKKTIYPSIWCCDQEPLDHEYYRKNLRISDNSKIFRKPINLNYQHGIFEKSLLLHSEKRSQNLEQHLRDGELIGVYYWSHAIIARDWFRYAEHETFHKDSKKLFLIYNRAWSNTREYRLYFAELLVNQNLIDHCQTTCNSIDPELQMHYCEYTFKNPQWKPNKSLENYFVPNTAVASSSADFNVNDYNFTDIEVVLETLFDDNRIQLTEKILRPIACGHPFILASTQGSLEYLKSYGFQTFETVWDESYDQIIDAKQRLVAITDLMKIITDWDDETKKCKLAQARDIATKNRQRFFSKDFFDQVTGELKINFVNAFKELEQGNNYRPWIDRWEKLIKDPEVIDYLEQLENDPNSSSRSRIEFVLDLARQKLIL